MLDHLPIIHKIRTALPFLMAQYQHVMFVVTLW
jgi:hypothetical protein